MSRSVSSSSLTPGLWIARFGAWQVNVRTVGDSWDAGLWSCVRGVVGVHIAEGVAFATASDALAWACEVMRQHGAMVFVDGRVHPLEKFLAFSPAPRAIICG